jgi:hypothetical protein
MLGGTKKQSTAGFPNSSYPMQICILLSLESRVEKPRGMIALPCFEMTCNCAGPPPAGVNQMAVSTGAQSISWQHSRGYHECAFAKPTVPVTAIAAVIAHPVARPNMMSIRVSTVQALSVAEPARME